MPSVFGEGDSGEGAPRIVTVRNSACRGIEIWWTAVVYLAMGIRLHVGDLAVTAMPMAWTTTLRYYFVLLFLSWGDRCTIKGHSYPF